MPRRAPLCLSALAGLVLLTSACEFFEGADDGETETGTTGEPAETTESEPDWPPDEGFRVLPQYRLVDVTATVSVEIAGEVFPCLSDPVEGGYLCDTTDAPGPVPITVEREGFETAVRTPELGPSIEALVVHLAIEGGPEGAWSPCVADGAFTSCTEVCADAALGCLPASCTTEDPEQPLASVAQSADAGCMAGVTELAFTACDDPLPAAGLGYLQCCCSMP